MPSVLVEESLQDEARLLVVAQKVKALLEAGITPIYCCGEKQEERTAGRHFEVVSAQMKDALGALDPEQLMKVVVAYEPVWAIGTGQVATPAQAGEVHGWIHERLASFDPNGSQVPVLYGGSVKPGNIAELASTPGIDGALVGGASLEAESFLKIVQGVLKAS